ncbi:nuclear hormone receptor HR96-like [Paramacrobiotus metropolitanus]|uniref:nuclear hormone receptor HR96-like n=1 Tax=Paramacrobiotus metropolitanus TaxID=2943436 RepID=UPI0024455F6A|nr:nuclear hormone receptor HR96-like [Paramacrobiotus metropolitanus]
MYFDFSRVLLSGVDPLSALNGMDSLESPPSIDTPLENSPSSSSGAPSSVRQAVSSPVDSQELSHSKERSSPGCPAKTCRVCGDVALNMNFGAITCESCKAFFRRNALGGKEFKCPFEGNCNVDTESRRWCQQCRLRKCFTVGMRRELIQKGKRPSDDLGGGRYEDSLVCPEAAPLADTVPKSPAKRPRTRQPKVIAVLRNTVKEEVRDESVGEIMQNVSSVEISSPTPSAESCSSHDPFPDGLELLSLFEKQKIMELVKANEVMYEANTGDDPLAVRYQEQHHRLVDVINMTDIAIRRLIKMSKRISEFRNLLQEDQIALLKGACFEMMILRAVSHYDLEKDCWQGPQATLIKVDVLKEARGNCYEEIRTFIRSFAPELRQDEPLLLIMGAVVLFHPGRPALEHCGQIGAQQSLYFYLLHSYLRSKYAKNSKEEIEALYTQMTSRIEILHKLNDRHITMFLDLNPEQVEPLLIEIFDLNRHATRRGDETSALVKIQ